MRAQARDEVLATTINDLRTAAPAFSALPASPLVKALAGPDAAAKARAARTGLLEPVRVLE